MSKFLFFDIDGTLVGKSRHITEKTKEAIQAAKNAGNKVFLCTGRAPTSIVGDVKALPIDGIVASAGGFVQVDGKYIFKNYMDQYTLSEMMTLFVNHGILFCLETEHAIYQTPGVNEFFDKRHNKEFGDNVELQRFFELKRQEENRIPVSQFDLEKTGVTKIGFIAPDPIAFYDCVKYIAPMFNIVTFSKYEDDFINGEIILKNCTKADGVRRVVDYYHGDMKDTIGFGDSMNDASLLQSTHVGIAMGNACDELKQYADYITDDIGNDGIYKALKKYGLLE